MSFNIGIRRSLVDEVNYTRGNTMKGNKYKYEQQNKRTTKKDRHSNKQETANDGFVIVRRIACRTRQRRKSTSSKN